MRYFCFGGAKVVFLGAWKLGSVEAWELGRVERGGGGDQRLGVADNFDPAFALRAQRDQSFVHATKSNKNVNI